ncbi:MAG: S8 family serine peptidase [Gemmatimonadota bacterium]|nr:S8 family serine peptidase [Gemmatimonadota bacterium]
MKKLVLLALAASTVIACQDTATAPRSRVAASRTAVASTSDVVPDRYIVVFRAGVADAPALTRQIMDRYAGVLFHSYGSALKGFAAQLSASAVATLRFHPDITLIEQDRTVHLSGTESGATWGIDRIDQLDLPLNGTYNYGPTGSGVSAYIIDTGIRTTHVEFGGRASGVYTAINDGNGTADCNGHGTHVAGTVGGVTYGVAKQVKLYAVRVLDCSGSGLVSGIIAAVDWVTANRQGPSVANMSLGGSISSSLDQAVENSIASGVTYAVAAGNSNSDACGGSPARAPDALTVAATTSIDARASYSSWGSCVDLFAPGSAITSAWNGSDTQTNTISGTSMATPHVTGAAALYLQNNPTASAAQVAQALKTNATPNRISDVVGSPNLLLYTGFLNAAPPPDQPPVARFTYSCTGLTCTFDGRSSTDDRGIVSYDWTFGMSPNGTGSGAVVTATYPHTSQRTVTLTVTDGAGQRNSTTQVITVSDVPPPSDQPPVARFTYSCTGLTCTFDGRNSTDDRGIVSYDWNFGMSPNGTGSGAVVTATYPHTSQRTVTLTVTDGAGQSNSATQVITVSDGPPPPPPPTDQPPVARFTVTCNGWTCTFDGSSSSDDKGIVSYSWDLGKSPGGTATGQVVTTSYPHSGSRTVTLTVTDTIGQTASSTRTFILP